MCCVDYPGTLRNDAAELLNVIVGAVKTKTVQLNFNSPLLNVGGDKLNQKCQHREIQLEESDRCVVTEPFKAEMFFQLYDQTAKS